MGDNMEFTDQRLADDAVEQAEEAVRLAREAFRANLDFFVSDRFT